MIDKWVTSLRFNEIKNEKKILRWFLIISFSVGWPRLLSWVLHQSRDFLRSDVSLGSQCGCLLRLFIECVCVWSTKSSTMLAYCIAANCNNSQATQSITMHEFLRNRPTVRRKWVKFVQFKRADFDAAPQSRPFVYKHFTECDFVNFTAEYQMGFASKRNL